MEMKSLRLISVSPSWTLMLVVGLADSPGWSNDDVRIRLDDLLRKADDALDRAKVICRNRVELAT